MHYLQGRQSKMGRNFHIIFTIDCHITFDLKMLTLSYNLILPAHYCFLSVFFFLESTSLEWRPKTGLVRYTAPASNGGQGVDRLALGLITPQVDAVLLRLDYTKEPTRFLELSIVSQQNKN
jgi:hypothetical protein